MILLRLSITQLADRQSDDEATTGVPMSVETVRADITMLKQAKGYNVLFCNDHCSLGVSARMAEVRILVCLHPTGLVNRHRY